LAPVQTAYAGGNARPDDAATVEVQPAPAPAGQTPATAAEPAPAVPASTLAMIDAALIKSPAAAHSASALRAGVAPLALAPKRRNYGESSGAMASVSSKLRTDLANALPKQQRRDIQWANALRKTATDLATSASDDKTARQPG
jgi:hypothetical protein